MSRVIEHLTLPISQDGRNTVTGRFFVVVHDAVYWAVDVPGVKPGTPFGVQHKRVSTKKVLTWYQRFDKGIYYLIRSYDIHTEEWRLENAEIVSKFGLLARANLMATYGVQILSPDEFFKLQQELAGLLALKDPKVSMTEIVNAMVTMYVLTDSKRTGSRRNLGMASALANAELRSRDLERIGSVVLSVRSIVAAEVDEIMRTVTAIRTQLDTFLKDDDYWNTVVAEKLDEFAMMLRENLVVRPLTHVGDAAAKDCEDAVKIIQNTIDLPVTTREGAAQGVRNLLLAARDSLILVLAQHNMEGLIGAMSGVIERGATSESPAYRDVMEVAEQEVSNIRREVKPFCGRTFTRRKNPVPELLTVLGDAHELVHRAAALETIKTKIATVSSVKI